MTGPRIEPMYSKAKLAQLLGYSTRTVDIWVAKGLIPQPSLLPNGRRAWRESDVQAMVFGRTGAAR